MRFSHAGQNISLFEKYELNFDMSNGTETTMHFGDEFVPKNGSKNLEQHSNGTTREKVKVTSRKLCIESYFEYS